MASGPEILDAVVVGAGWAGLGVSHALARKGLRQRVLERARIGETWRTQRWDSFRMNTPNVHTVMPGDRFDGPDPEGAMTARAFVALLEEFARRHRLPVEQGTPVTALTKGPHGAYRLITPDGTLLARNVVLATGSLTRPVRPPIAAAVRGLHQIDACDYRCAAALPDGSVLVVGNAQSGGQIAEDLAEAGRTVFLATSRVGRMPRCYRGQDVSIWLVRSGLFDLPRTATRPLLGALHTISLQSLSAQGIVLLGRFTGVRNGHLHFADDLEENIRFANESSAVVKLQIDEYIERAGIDAPPAEPDPAETVAPRLPDPPMRSLDPAACGLTTVIWCIGFRGDFRWVRLPVLDTQGQPVHDDGVTPLPGIYVAGSDYGPTRRSGTIHAIAEEAPRLAKLIAARC